jgi:transposase
MVTLGVDAHKRTHTIVAVDDQGRQLGVTTVGTRTKDHLGLLRWAQRLGDGERRWAIEDCRHLSRRLEKDLLAAGESVLRVPAKLMAHVRDSARTYGKSDPIDALAVARAALREPDLPAAHLDGPERDVRLLVDYRETLVAERTRLICRLRWNLHELDPGWEPNAQSLDRLSAYRIVEEHLADAHGLAADLARRMLDRLRQLTPEINQLEHDIADLVKTLAPSLLAAVGCGPLTAAKIVGETAGIARFKSKDAYARHNGTAPLPVWSSNKARHRLSRTGNRQLNAAVHRIALTQAHWHEPAKAMMGRRKAGGDSGLEALRILKRRLSDVVYAALRADLPKEPTAAAA